VDRARGRVVLAYLKRDVLARHNPSMIASLAGAGPRAGWLSCNDVDLFAMLLFSIVDLHLKHRETPL
jgi:hypothetical protein